MSVTTIDGHLAHYEAFGRGKPVIFVHGWLGSWRYWWPTMQALSNYHRSFAVDLWGFGDSSKTAACYTLDCYVDMLTGFADSLGISRPFTLVGHSLGAAVATRYARLSPGSVERLAAVSAPMSGEHINGQFTGRSVDALLDHSKNRFDAFPEVAMGLDKADAAALSASLGQIGLLNLAEELQDVDCPVLLIFGSDDRLVRQPKDELKGSNGSCGHHIVCLDGSGHFPMLEEPAVFNRLLREFINHADGSELAPKNYWQRRTR